MTESTNQSLDAARPRPAEIVLTYESSDLTRGEPDVTRAILWGGVAYAGLCVAYAGVVLIATNVRWPEIGLVSLIGGADACLLVLSARALRRGASLRLLRGAVPALLLVSGAGLVLYYLRAPPNQLEALIGWTLVVVNIAVNWLLWLLWPIVMCWSLNRRRQQRPALPTVNDLIAGAILLGALESLQQWLPWVKDPSLLPQAVTGRLRNLGGVCSLMLMAAGPALVVLGLLARRGRRHRKTYLTVAAGLLIGSTVTMPIVNTIARNHPLWQGAALLTWDVALMMPLIVATAVAWQQRIKP